MALEQALEELQLLESQHPNRFHYLKLELKSFISFLQSQTIGSIAAPVPPASSTASDRGNYLRSSNLFVLSGIFSSLFVLSLGERTASSTGKKRKRCSSGIGIRMVQKVGRADDGVEVAIERARACLRKIQQFKTSCFH